MKLAGEKQSLLVNKRFDENANPQTGEAHFLPVTMDSGNDVGVDFSEK